MPAHIVMTTFGSLGDLHPYIAVGLELRRRGHDVTLATSEVYRAKVEGEGLGFHAVRPDLGKMIDNPDMMRRSFHPRTGSEFLLRRVILPYIEQAYEDTLPIARRADLLVSHPIAFATPVAAEALGKRWASVVLQPSLVFSAWDPPAIPAAPMLRHFRRFGPWFWKALWKLARRVGRRWGAPINRLRVKVGLPWLGDPLFGSMFSPHLSLAWFSKVLAAPQPDWPAKLQVTGFPFYDKLEAGRHLSPEIARFLDAGPPPVVFTLGSSAVFDAGGFYSESLAAVKEMGCRAILLIGRDPRNQPAGPLPENVLTAEYAPYSELFPLAAAIVHQGGAGTTAQALQAGRPMIVVPWSHDQPDHAMRIVRLGVGRTIPRGRYRKPRVIRELQALLRDAECERRSREVAAEMGREDGVAGACDAIEALLD